MNRRHLLQAMLTLPVAGAVSGCRYEHHHRPPGVSSRGGTLRVILQGPFVLVLQSKNDYRIKAYVPYDADGLHEFRYLDPHKRTNGEKTQDGRRNQYQFTLPEAHLAISSGPPHIDSGFYDFQLRAGAWQPMPSEYFVALDLPKPDRITFVPPTIPVVMAGNRLAMMPTNHVLEYSVPDYDDIRKVVVHSPQFPDQPPVSCSDLLGYYRGYWTQMEQLHREYEDRLHQSMESELTGCSSVPVSAFFFGVGLPPDTNDFDNQAKQHALAFFNTKVLGSLPNSPDASSKKLLEVDVKPCSAPSGGGARFISAVQSYPQPRLVPVSSADDCRAGGVVATG